MFTKLLIANRGEIAVRVIRACKDLDIKTVAVYSEADKDSLHVIMADEAVCIGKPPSSESYLDVAKIVKTAQETNSEAIHPGYGFLSENDAFVASCAEAGIVFVGPSREIMRKMGNKSEARSTMTSARVPVIPGSTRAVRDPGEAAKIADKIGCPVIIKASAGGGGKGMRVVKDKADLMIDLPLARQEAETFFSDDSVYVEKHLESGRYIEVQILADTHSAVGGQERESRRNSSRLMYRDIHQETVKCPEN